MGFDAKQSPSPPRPATKEEEQKYTMTGDLPPLRAEGEPDAFEPKISLRIVLPKSNPCFAKRVSTTRKSITRS